MQNNSTITPPTISELKVIPIFKNNNNKKEKKQFAKQLLFALTVRSFGIPVIK